MKTPTTLGFTILGLLAGGPMSGYDVRRRFATTPLGYYSDSPGAIYPALRRLGAEGLAVSRHDPRARGRGRELWSLTAEGRRRFRAWLEVPPTPESVRYEHDAELMKFAHLAEFDDPARVERFLVAYRSAIRLQAGDLRAFLATRPAAMPWTGVRAVELGLATLELRARWAAEAKPPRRRSR